MFNENSCHLLDVLCHLLGRPVSVAAATHNPRARPSAELGAVLLTFQSGAIAALTLGAHSAGALQEFPRLDLVTANGRANLQGHGHIWSRLTWARRNEEEYHVFNAHPEYLGETRYSEALRQFINSVRTGAPVPATIEEGMLAVDLAAAIAESARTERTVQIPPKDSNPPSRPSQ